MFLEVNDLRKYLLPQNGNFYKANLHTHSTVSDGELTPEELKKRYKAHGYSILAYTDHEILVDHSDLNDENFLALTGIEYAFMEQPDYRLSKTIELNIIAKDPHNTTQICFDPSYVYHGELWRVPIAKRIGEPFERKYTIECIQEVIDTAKKHGFLVNLNHPCGSLETPEFFGKLNGLLALEIYNHSSFIWNGVYDYVPDMYDDMLRRGHNIYCLAADDAHGGLDDDNPRCDRYGGFVMIKANSLTYENVINALEQGDFYASQGPLIEELYVEDGYIHIRTSPARSIAMNTEHRPFGGISVAPKGETLTEAVFKVPENQKYIRFDVIDECGFHANTRGFYIENII